MPDALATSPTSARIVTVPDGGQVTFADATNPVTAYHMLSGHAEDMLVIHAEGSDHVFESDAYPNIGDVFYVSGYILIAAGLSMLWRSQRAIANVGALVDGLIVGVAAAPAALMAAWNADENAAAFAVPVNAGLTE